MKRVLNSGFIPLGVLIVMISVAATNAAAQKAAMEVTELKASATQSSIVLSGQVKNISSDDIGGVTVYCDFINGSHRVVDTAQTTLETDPLAPNKTTGFKCSTKRSPAIKGYNLPRFVRLFGGPLVVKDSRGR